MPETRVVISTKFGNIELRFFSGVAPHHVDNFIKVAGEGFYEGTTFHRVIPDFLIQGGDPNSRGPDRLTHGKGGPGYTIKAELNDRPHKRGTLSMARGASPDSAGYQSFICLDEASELNGQYTVFGEVVSGIRVAEKISRQPKDKKDNPTEKIEIKVKIVEK